MQSNSNITPHEARLIKEYRKLIPKTHSKVAKKGTTYLHTAQAILNPDVAAQVPNARALRKAIFLGYASIKYQSPYPEMIISNLEAQDKFAKMEYDIEEFRDYVPKECRKYFSKVTYTTKFPSQRYDSSSPTFKKQVAMRISVPDNYINAICIPEVRKSTLDFPPNHQVMNRIAEIKNYFLKQGRSHLLYKKYRHTQKGNVSFFRKSKRLNNAQIILKELKTIDWDAINNYTANGDIEVLNDPLGYWASR